MRVGALALAAVLAVVAVPGLAAAHHEDCGTWHQAGLLVDVYVGWWAPRYGSCWGATLEVYAGCPVAGGAADVGPLRLDWMDPSFGANWCSVAGVWVPGD